MAYSDFDLKKAKSTFGLTLVETEDLFAFIEPVAISPLLTEILKQNVPLAMAMGTAKASSELVIANIFLELKRRYPVSFFSGLEFNMDNDQGLNGFCDFLISLSPEQLFLDTSILAIVEAKNERIATGLGQCVAEMLAAQIYNDREGKRLASVYGAVTTGLAWKFLRLQDSTVYIDLADYYIDRPDKILGILATMVENPIMAKSPRT
jgi:hypothetical protein